MSSKPMHTWIRIALAWVSVSGCDSVESTEVDTAQLGLFANVEVAQDGSAELITQLSTDNPALLEVTYVRLGPEDELSATVDGRAVRIREQQVVPLGLWQYSALLDDIAGGETVTVALYRQRYADALQSSVQLPMPFELAPVAPDGSRARGLQLSWSTGSAADYTSIHGTGACIPSFSLKLEGNPGQAFISPADLGTPEGAAASCQLTLKVKVTNSGVVDPAFGRGGHITAAQVRSVQFELTP